MAHIPFVFVLLTTSNHLLSAQPQDGYVTVRTAQGLLRGFQTQSVRNKDVFAFLGVPYARPPVGHLRFKVPYIVCFLRLV